MMNNLYLKSSLPIIVILMLVLVLVSRPSAHDAEASQPRIDWVSLGKAFTISQKNPKPILVEVYTENCHKCQSMEKTTFQNPEIIDFLNQNYYVVRLDANSEEIVEFDGKNMSVRDLVKNEFKVSVYPTIIYLDNYKISAVVPYYQSPKELQTYLEYYAN